MRIFIGYHYGPSDAWVKNHVYRVVKAFGDELESGEQLYLAPNLPQGVIDKIQNSDALIGVASRRDQLANGLFTTHTWVKDELTVARTTSKLFVQLRETGLWPRSAPGPPDVGHAPQATGPATATDRRAKKRHPCS